MVNIGNFWQFLAVQTSLSGDQYNATRSNMNIATYKLPALPYAYNVSRFFSVFFFCSGPVFYFLGRT